MLKVAIITGSTRPGRVNEQVAKWVYAEAQKRSDATFELVDIQDYNLPLLDEPVPPSMGQYSKEHTKKWAAKIASFDAFVFVTPEYNHGISGALKKKLGIAPESTGPGEMGVPDWAWKEWDAILREWERGYQATCAQWWNAAGPMHAHMKRYRDFLVQERVPHHHKHVDEPVLKNYQMTNVSSKGYRSVADFVAVEDYLKRAGRIFSQRLDRPRCTAQRCDR